MSTDITRLLPPKTTVPTPQQMAVRGTIAQAPSSLADDTVTVTLPSYSADYGWPCRWVRQGDALPAVNADCLVVWDETGAGTVVWFAAAIIAARFIGEIAESALATPPTGWISCDGSAVTSAHQALRAALLADGAVHGMSGSDPLVPDKRGKVGLGVSGSHALGSTGGEETHTLSSSEMPSHTHTIAFRAAQAATGAAVAVPDSASGTTYATGSAGSGTAHNNLQPYVAVNYVIYAGF